MTSQQKSKQTAAGKGNIPFGALKYLQHYVITEHKELEVTLNICQQFKNYEGVCNEFGPVINTLQAYTYYNA